MAEKALTAVIQEVYVQGISKSPVSRLCEEIDGKLKAFLNRTLTGDWPYLWIDATYLKVRRGGRIVSVAVIIAIGVNTDGRREVLGLEIGTSEAEPIWTELLRGVRLIISDAHKGLKAAVSKALCATWQRCRVHFMRNALAHVPKGQHTVVAAAIRQAFLPPDHRSTGETWRHVADQLRTRWPRLGTLMDEVEADVLAYLTFPSQHRTKLHSTDG